jgi:hypothetical protein
VPAARLTRAQVVVNCGVGAGLALLFLGVAVPPVAAAGFLLALVSTVAMAVQLPARLRARRPAIRPVRRPTTARPPDLASRAAAHSDDYDPDVITENPATGFSTWTCACGAAATGGYLSPEFARKSFLKHKYDVPWPNPNPNP